MSEDETIRMTSADLLDWFIGHGCTSEPLPPSKGNALKIVNPKNGCEFYLGLPINNTPIKDYLVYRYCMRLSIPVPTHSSYCRGIHDKIESEDE